MKVPSYGVPRDERCELNWMERRTNDSILSAKLMKPEIYDIIEYDIGHVLGDKL